MIIIIMMIIILIIIIIKATTRRSSTVELQVGAEAPLPSFMLGPPPPRVFASNIVLAPTYSWLICLISFININILTFLFP